MKSLMEFLTTWGWFRTWLISNPTGRLPRISAIFLFRFSPRRRLLPPSVMEMAMPMAGLPLKYIFGSAGSAYPRSTRAMSPRRRTRPLPLTGRDSMFWIVSGIPVRRRYVFRVSSCFMGAGVTDVSAAMTRARSSTLRPSWASFVLST